MGSKPKILIVGLGSIGSKYARLLRENYDVELFALRHSNNPWHSVHIENLYNWNEVEMVQPTAALITNPTSYHTQTAFQCAIRGIPFWVEKPLSNSLVGLDSVMKEVEKRNLATYVAYPLRHLPEIKKLKEENPSSAWFVCLSDAANWPSRRKLDHVLLELSHELDLAQYLFGKIDHIQGKTTETKARLMTIHSNGKTAVYDLDIASEVEDRHIFLMDGRINIKVTDELYLAQLDYFLNNLDNPNMMNCIQEAHPLLEKIVEFINK